MSEKILYKDEVISVRESLKENEKYIYTHEEISGGKRIVILPFRKKFGGRQFLLRREYIPCWDSHTDVCAISSKVYENDPEQTALKEIQKATGYLVKTSELMGLGVVSASKSSDTTYYLYGLDLSKHDKEEEKLEIHEDMSFWGDEDDIMDSIDAQLVACFGKLRYLFF